MQWSSLPKAPWACSSSYSWSRKSRLLLLGNPRIVNLWDTLVHCSRLAATLSYSSVALGNSSDSSLKGQQRNILFFISHLHGKKLKCKTIKENLHALLLYVVRTYRHTHKYIPYTSTFSKQGLHCPVIKLDFLSNVMRITVCSSSSVLNEAQMSSKKKSCRKTLVFNSSLKYYKYLATPDPYPNSQQIPITKSIFPKSLKA